MTHHAPEFMKCLDGGAVDLQIYCIGVGNQRIPTGVHQPYRPELHPPLYPYDIGPGRVLDQYQLVYVVDGGGRFECSGVAPVPIHAGTAFLLFPALRHNYCADLETGWYWVGFNGSFMDTLVQQRFFTPEAPIFEIGLHDSLVSGYQDIFDTLEDEPPGFQLIAAGIIIKMLGLVHSLARQDQRTDGTERLVEKAKCRFAEHVNGRLDMRAVSADLHVGYSAFSRVFKRTTGVSPYHYFLSMKVEKAKALLADARLPVKEVAHRLSFDNQNYFSRLFKRMTGVAPSRWHEWDGAGGRS